MNDIDRETKASQAYIRSLNAGNSAWELDPPMVEEHPIFLRKEHSQENEGAKYQALPAGFQPSEDILMYLREYRQIPQDFIEIHLIEFKLYWNETGEKRKAWNNRFKSYVIYQWNKNQDEKRRKHRKTTFEKLTDRSWAQGLLLDIDD